MPELPEVETVRLQLSHVLPNQQFIAVIRNRPASLKGDDAQIVGKQILAVRRYSKLLVIDLSDNISLAIHLRMTGRLIFDRQAGRGKRTADDKHTHVVLQFDSGDRLFFHDQRAFGYIQIVPTHQIEALPYVKTLGPEFFRNLTEAQFIEILRKAKRAIKVVLLDQQKLGGVGNIYANEGLWMAQIHPARPAAQLRPAEAKKLFQSLCEIMQKAISYGGASSRDFRDAYGKKGTVQDYLAVYERAGKECPRCGHPIKKYMLAGRGTYVCEKCQA